MLDGDGKFLHVNRAIGELLEYEQNDVIQRPFGEFLQSAGKSNFEGFIKPKAWTKIKRHFFISQRKWCDCRIRNECCNSRKRPDSRSTSQRRRMEFQG